MAFDSEEFNAASEDLAETNRVAASEVRRVRQFIGTPRQEKLMTTRAELTRLTTRDKDAFWAIAENYGIKRARGLQYGE